MLTIPGNLVDGTWVLWYFGIYAVLLGFKFVRKKFLGNLVDGHPATIVLRTFLHSEHCSDDDEDTVSMNAEVSEWYKHISISLSFSF